MLNNITIPDRYPIPHVQHFARNLAGCRSFSKIDLTRAYFQIPVHPEDIPKTAISIPLRLFEFVRMPFGLRNAGQTFQRFMDEVTRGLSATYVYLDDLLIASPDEESHEKHLRQLSKLKNNRRLRDYGLVINPRKCLFGMPELSFLVHHVSAKGIKPLEERVKTLSDYPKPSTAAKLLRFLGIFNYYHRFVPQAAAVLSPLNSLVASTKKATSDVPWTQDTERSFV
jgi:hypothetical protein